MGEDWIPKKGDLVRQLNSTELWEVKEDWAGEPQFVALIRPYGEVSGTLYIGRQGIWLHTSAEERVAKELMR